MMLQAHARHILVKTQEECERLKARIDAGEDFAKLAAEYSLCPSRLRGGDMGHFFPGEIVPDLDDVVFEAEVGKTHGPVRSRFGYHVVQIVSREEM
jgi:peptidyl-prolyl cis-trans isomerase C